MFPIPEKPAEKQCRKCGSLVHPGWRTVVLDDESGWVGNSTCPSCGNVQVHLAGAPSFVMSAHASLKEGGFLAD
jgi:Zn finger protein HypA/HybF involved in hydrogenase expression